MVIKIALAVFFLGLAILFVGQQHKSNEEIKNRIKRGRIIVAIEEAKAKQQREVILPAPIPLYAAVTSLNDALAHYVTVIAEPIQAHSQINSDSKEIETWYKARIIDNLSTPVPSLCPSCPLPATIPIQFHPVAADEVVFIKNGGTIISDGVAVTSLDRSFPELKIHQSYLIFLSLDPRTRVGSIDLGPTGVLAIWPNGDLMPLAGKASQLHKELLTQYGNIGEVKKQLRFRRFPSS